MTGSPRHFSVSRLLVLVAVSYASFATSVAAHALPGAPSRVADGGETSSPPTPTPVHEQNDCPFCQAGSRAFTPLAHQIDTLLPLETAPAPRSTRSAVPRTPEASLEVARAPPHDLFR